MDDDAWPAVLAPLGDIRNNHTDRQQRDELPGIKGQVPQPPQQTVNRPRPPPMGLFLPWQDVPAPPQFFTKDVEKQHHEKQHRHTPIALQWSPDIIGPKSQIKDRLWVQPRREEIRRCNCWEGAHQQLSGKAQPTETEIHHNPHDCPQPICSGHWQQAQAPFQSAPRDRIAIAFAQPEGKREQDGDRYREADNKGIEWRQSQANERWCSSVERETKEQRGQAKVQQRLPERQRSERAGALLCACRLNGYRGHGLVPFCLVSSDTYRRTSM